MTQPSDQAMRDLIKAEVRLAVANYFLPLRMIARWVAQAARYVAGRPNPAGRGGSSAHPWWRSA